MGWPWVAIQQQCDVTELCACPLQICLHVLDQRCAWRGVKDLSRCPAPHPSRPKAKRAALYPGLGTPYTPPLHIVLVVSSFPSQKCHQPCSLLPSAPQTNWSMAAPHTTLRLSAPNGTSWSQLGPLCLLPALCWAPLQAHLCGCWSLGVTKGQWLGWAQAPKRGRHERTCGLLSGLGGDKKALGA